MCRKESSIFRRCHSAITDPRRPNLTLNMMWEAEVAFQAKIKNLEHLRVEGIKTLEELNFKVDYFSFCNSSTLEEIDETYNALKDKCTSLAFMNCVSEYPPVSKVTPFPTKQTSGLEFLFFVPSCFWPLHAIIHLLLRRHMKIYPLSMVHWIQTRILNMFVLERPI